MFIQLLLDIDVSELREEIPNIFENDDQTSVNEGNLSLNLDGIYILEKDRFEVLELLNSKYPYLLVVVIMVIIHLHALKGTLLPFLNQLASYLGCFGNIAYRKLATRLNAKMGDCSFRMVRFLILVPVFLRYLHTEFISPR